MLICEYTLIQHNARDAADSMAYAQSCSKYNSQAITHLSVTEPNPI